MRASLTAGQVFKIAFAGIFWFVLVVLFLLSVPVIMSVTPLLLLVVAGVALLVALVVWMIRRVFSTPFNRPSYWVTWLATTMVLTAVLALPVYWLAWKAESDPMALPLATLSNGEKTVVFQGMVHIGSEDFYKSVVYDLENALAEGYDLFYEGVQPGDAEAEDWFNAFMDTGGADLGDNYRALAELCGVEFQLDYFTLLENDKRVHPDRHVTADVDKRQMMDEWQRLHPGVSWRTALAGDTVADKIANAEATDPMTGALEFIEAGPEGRKDVSGIFCRAMLSNAMDPDKGGNPQKDAIILDFRNAALVDRIVSHPGDKIYITYGAAHLPGVIRMLKQRNPEWNVESIRWVRAIRPPREYEGVLEY